MAKKAAAKKTSGVNKSELVRAYMAANPTDKPKVVAEAVSKQAGVEITANYVSVVKQNSKAKGKKAGGGKRGRKAAAAAGPNQGTIGVLSAAESFIAAAGGISAAQDVLAALARLRV